MGEYKIPFEITAKKEQVQSFGSEIKDMPAFRELAQRDFREAYRLFTDSSFSVVMAGADRKQKALYAGLSQQPVTYQHLEEFLIGLREKDPVTISLKTTETEYFGVEESIQESFDIHRSGWGHLRLDIEAKGEFLEPERRVITEDDFIGSTCQIDYLVHADRLKGGNQYG